MLVERGGTAQHVVLGVYTQFVAAIVPVHRKIYIAFNSELTTVSGFQVISPSLIFFDEALQNCNRSNG